MKLIHSARFTASYIPGRLFAARVYSSYGKFSSRMEPCGIGRAVI